MKLIVGLGNPGRRYQATRHNIGFDVLDEVARRQGSPTRRSQFQAEVSAVALNGHKVVLLWPQTFMNLAGNSVGRITEYYGLERTELLVVCDDFHLPLGKIRIRAQGSAGGQKGLADIIRRLGTEQFARLRVGIGPVPDGWDPADFVLGRFQRQEGAEVEQIVGRAADAVQDWTGPGTAYCMNRYNG